MYLLGSYDFKFGFSTCILDFRMLRLGSLVLNVFDGGTGGKRDCCSFSYFSMEHTALASKLPECFIMTDANLSSLSLCSF